jgi:hypothetical protein
MSVIVSERGLGMDTHPECCNNSITLRYVCLKANIGARAPPWQMLTRNGFFAQPNANALLHRVRILFKPVTAVLSTAMEKRQVHLVQNNSDSKYDKEGNVSGGAGRVLLPICLLTGQCL